MNFCPEPIQFTAHASRMLLSLLLYFLHLLSSTLILIRELYELGLWDGEKFQWRNKIPEWRLTSKINGKEWLSRKSIIL